MGKFTTQIGAIGTILAAVTYLMLYLNITTLDPDRIPVILFYEPHSEKWFSTFNTSVYCENTCEFTYNRTHFNDSDAVIFFRTINGIPPIKKENQTWIYMTFEPPNRRTQGILPNKEWLNVLDDFDWLLSYHSKSELHVPFGRLEKLKERNETNLNYSMEYLKKDKEIAWVVSHCDTHSLREKYVQELRKYINVDIYGSCGDNKCPEASNSAKSRLDTFRKCKAILSGQYKFYISFEHSWCDEYTSEKVFEMYEADNLMIPIVRGDLNISYSLPPNTYISTSDFPSVKELANYLKYISSNEQLYTSILKAKLQYKVIRWEENYVSAICDLCSRLKSKDLESRQEKFNLTKWIFIDSCIKPTDIE